MIVVFDLDDTLYKEITYVKSAFDSVAKYLAHKHNLNRQTVYSDLIDVLNQKGRGHVFNDVLKKHDIYSKYEVQRCLAVYRSSVPKIQLNNEAVECLKSFKHLPLYVVTDGNKIVQRAKIKALNVERYVKRALPTHAFGVRHSKPSTYVFHKILIWEKAVSSELLYVGDNPHKDFVNLKKEGFRTLRVRTGMFANVRLDQQYEADFEIKSLAELDLSLLKKIFS